MKYQRFPKWGCKHIGNIENLSLWKRLDSFDKHHKILFEAFQRKSTSFPELYFKIHILVAFKITNYIKFTLQKSFWKKSNKRCTLIAQRNKKMIVLFDQKKLFEIVCTILIVRFFFTINERIFLKVLNKQLTFFTERTIFSIFYWKKWNK